MRLVAHVIAFTLLPSTLLAQHSDPLQGFNSYVTAAVREWEAPGLAVGVVKDDSVVFARGYGVLRAGESMPVTINTLFANASTTKAFTAMAIAMLVDDSLLSWDDRAAEHLSHFVMPDPYVTSEIRIRDLMSHRVGFGDPQYLWYGKDYAFDDVLARLRHVEPRSSFRSRYAYNNIAVATAGEIAGRVAGNGWDQLVRVRILEPLGMTSTYTRGSLLPASAQVATPHDHIEGTITPIDALGLVDSIPAAGSMYSTIADMTKWIRFLLNEGTVGDDTLVSEDRFNEMFQPQTIIRPEQFYVTGLRTKPHFTAYGLGWYLHDYRGHLVAFHTGSIDGTVAIVGLIPELELGVVVFANRDHVEVRHALMLHVFDSFIGDPVRDWSTELKVLYDSLAAESRPTMDRLREERVEGTNPRKALDAYVGPYRDELYGDVEISLEAGALVLRQSEFLTAKLNHFQYDTFEAIWTPRWLWPDPVTFTFNPDGTIRGLEIGTGRYAERYRRAEKAVDGS